jgi:hypothetical protein
MEGLAVKEMQHGIYLYFCILAPFYYYSFAYLGSCLFVLNLFHQVEFATMFVPGKRNANPSNYQVTTASSNHIP